MNNDSGFITGFTETDPTVPSWAKQSTKPSYNYSEIGNTPDLSGFITKSVNDLTNYYLKSETYTQAEVAALIGAIQNFHYEFYASTSAVTNPQGNVLYLIGPTGTGSDRYEEYVYASNAFTKIGDTSIDLSGYVTTSALNTALAGYCGIEIFDGDIYIGDYDSSGCRYIIGADGLIYAIGEGNSGDQDKILATTDYVDNAVSTKYTKPQSGIPASDLASGVIPTVPVQDVTVGGTSVVSNGVAVVPAIPDISGKADAATTLAGYGITDAKIENGVITLGSNTITPLTSHQSLTNYVQKSQTAGLLKNDGTVDTTQYLTQHQDLSDYVQKSNTTGLLKNDGTVDTTQYGTYSKPSSGIPSTDLESAVQTSLGKADTALQSFTESDPVFGASAASGITSSDISNWNGKEDKIPIINKGQTDYGTSSQPYTIQPNKFYVWGELTDLHLALDTVSNSYLDEFMFQFTSGATATDFSLPTSVKVIGTVEANKIYQCSIVNNLAVIGGA